MIGGVGIVGVSLVFVCGIAVGGFLPCSLLLPVSVLLILCFFLCLRRPSLSWAYALVFLAGTVASILSFLPSFSSDTHPFLLGTAENLRASIRSLPWQDPAIGELITALMTGDRSGLPRDMVRIFRDSGASHILALSGLHLGTIYLLAGRLLFFLRIGIPARRIRSVILVFFCGFYVLLTGAPQSVVRAFLFIFIKELASFLGRRTDLAHILCSALTIHLAFYPPALFNLGFQLSYLAMTGIITVYPYLKSFFPDKMREGPDLNPMRRMWTLFSLSISCQIFTGPLAWLRFGTFPKYFLLTNLLAMPLSTILITLSAIAIGADAIGICPDFLVAFDEAVARTLVRLLGFIQKS
ncbi:MAG: ComEC/Rec2 family competence protein [Bacteroidales bacterium]|nr:ComEC/Rec2 family competence protein [Bacteroidales bacterium]